MIAYRYRTWGAYSTLESPKNLQYIEIMSFISVLNARGLVQDVSDPAIESKIAPDSGFYVGFDPTSPNLHIGNLIQAIVAIHIAKNSNLRPIILFGGSTGSIGDPSGRTQERRLLDRETIEQNVASHINILRSIFDRVGVTCEYVDNYSWTQPISVLDFLRDTGKHFTVNYMIAKEVVKTRLEGEGISFTEFSYMILQALDFKHLYQSHNCRLQFGGSDQWGNITAGLELIRRSLQGEAFALSVPLCVDSEGRKFGKTAAGAVWINQEGLSPYEFHQYFLNVGDADVEKMLKTFTFTPLDEIAEIIRRHQESPEKRFAQLHLADRVTALVHGDDAVREANQSRSVLFGGSIEGIDERSLLKIFSGVPSTEIAVSEFEPLTAVDLFVRSGLTPSKGEARRLIQSGGAYVNNERVTDGTILATTMRKAERSIFVLRSGKKNYHLIKVI
jgi:tyrosyl-tRNA synthetase